MNKSHEIALEARQYPKERILAIGGILSALIVLIGVTTLAGSIYTAIRVYTPVWFWDEWSVAIDYKDLGGRYPLSSLWALHNEHRIPFVKSLQLLDLFWLKGDRSPLLVLNGITPIALWCVLVYFLHLMGRFSKMELATLAGIAAFFVFNPNQMENFTWFFQATFLNAFLFAVTALAAIGIYAHYEQQLSAERPPRKWLTLAIVSAILAELNLASGILTWIILPVCGVLLGVRRRIIILLCTVASPAIGVYLIGYEKPGWASAPGPAMLHLDRVFAFIVAYFAESWHYFAPRLGSAATIIALALILGFVVRTITRSERLEPLQAFALSLVLMMLLTAFITALGRQNLGLGYARIGRYQTPAMLFWWGLVLLMVSALTAVNSRMRFYRSYLFVALQILFVGLFVAEARHYPELLTRYVSDGLMRSTGGLAMEAGIYDESQIRSLYWRPRDVIPTYNFMLQRGLMRPPFKEYYQVGKSLRSVFSVLPEGSCAGSTDLIHQFEAHNGKQDLFAAGWGYYPAGKRAFKRVLAVSPKGTIVGVGYSGFRRQEIAAAHPDVVTADTGWRLYAVSEALGNPLEVYGIIPDTNQVCLLPGARNAPAALPTRVLPPLSTISDTLTGYIDALNWAFVTGSNDAQHPAHIDSTRALVIEGWVISGDPPDPMDQVFGVYLGGHVAGTPVARPDVVDLFKKGSLLMCGYQITVPPGTLAPGLQTIQIVGVRGDKYFRLPAAVYVVAEGQR